MSESSVIDELKKLVSLIRETIEKAKREGSLIPDKQAYFKWEVKDFTYDDSGVQCDGASGKEFLKDDWFRSFLAIHNVVENLPIYKNLESNLQSNFPEFIPDNLEQFVGYVIRAFLYEKVTPLFVDEVVTKFTNELEGENFLVGTEAELDGVYLQSKSIKLGERHMLRQTQLADLEIEYVRYSFETRNLFPVPSAILRLEFLGRGPFASQRKLARAIAILRLFRVGSIIFYKSRMFADSIISHGGGIGTSSHKDSPLNKYLIKENEVKALQLFWDELENKIPDTLTGFGAADLSFKDIAYKRYEDALLHNGTIERRIANAIMGIEAIFLTEQSELIYRLKLRVAKVMGLFNNDPFKVDTKIRDAYRIRSNFVHGGLLSYTEKEKLAEKYESVDNLLKDILDYLRISVVVAILMPVGKDAFLDTIDKSFLKKEFDNILNNYVQPAKEIII